MLKSRSLVVLLSAVCLVGCESSHVRIQRMNDLKLVGLAYHEFLDENEAGPTGWSNLNAESLKGVRQRLEAANYVVVWGLTRETAKQGLSNTLVAYPKDGPERGGKVLFFDGSVRDAAAGEIRELLGR